jgi:hypothetical protein
METNRLITGVESTFEKVTVDSRSFELKSKLGALWPMIRQCGRCWASVRFRRVATTLPVRIAAEPHFPRATASIQSPEAKACPTRLSSKNCIRSAKKARPARDTLRRHFRHNPLLNFPLEPW